MNDQLLNDKHFFQQVSDRRTVHSWAAKSGQQLTCGTVVNSNTHLYTAVFNSQVRPEKLNLG